MPLQVVDQCRLQRQEHRPRTCSEQLRLNPPAVRAKQPAAMLSFPPWIRSSALLTCQHDQASK